MFTSFPLPIHQISPSFSESWAETILLQAKDRRLHRLTSKKDFMGKYFAFKILLAKLWGFFKSLKPCLAKNALLKHISSQKPIPPII
jgi:hypothetical protein